MRYGHELLAARQVFRYRQRMLTHVMRGRRSALHSSQVNFWRRKRWEAWMVLRRELAR